MIFIGDIHGEFHRLGPILAGLAADETVICVGDIGLGFSQSRGPDCLQTIDALATGRRLKVLMLRGNHDDPAIWGERRDGWNERFEAIEILPDIALREIEGRKLLFVGGAISVDRTHSQRIPGISWWEDEGVVPDAESRVAEILRGEEIDVFVCHSAPIGAPPPTSNDTPILRAFSTWDKALMSDLRKERALLSQLHRLSGAPLVIYGHFHQSYDETIDGVRYRGLAELEAWRWS
jgi:predicted phosphodiesterase